MYEKIENYHRPVFCKWNRSTLNSLLILYQLIGILLKENDTKFLNVLII